MEQKEKKLKLYVFEGVLTDYTDGIAFAIAGSAKEAREAILKAYAKEHTSGMVGLRQMIDLLSGNSGYQAFKKELEATKPIVKSTVSGFYLYGGG